MKFTKYEFDFIFFYILAISDFNVPRRANNIKQYLTLKASSFASYYSGVGTHTIYLLGDASL